MVCRIGEITPKISGGKKIRTIKIMVKPKRSKRIRSRAMSSETSPVSTLKPSRGGNGNRLNKARPTFQIMAVLNILYMD